MQTKHKILYALSQSEGKPVSGQELGRALGVSRMAVSKAVKALEAEGYKINAQTNKGYTLENKSDVFIQRSIKEAYNAPVFFETKAASTNATAKTLAVSGACHGTLCAAAMQTIGRGRRGKSFFSPPGSGVYFSVILRDINLENAGLVTAAAAVAVRRAILSLYGVELSIKWVNDLYYKGRKVGGILTEAAADFETGEAEYAVVGIGLNLFEPKDGFPEELRGIAGYIFEREKQISRSEICAKTATELLQLCANGGFINEYKNASCIVGKKIDIIRSGISRRAFALGINERGHLIVRYESGEADTLYFGEVSISRL